ncbi:MAG: YqaE/Pmp3 family membrane protein [Chitinophagaceae bacterium]|nr:MAG: YqaE/Pmp3 family membrane protein [Chitinophagaceae bacterium]
MSASILTGSVTAASSFPTTNAAVPVTDPTTDPAPKASVRAAIAEFKSLSKKDRKLRVKEAKKQLKEYKKQKNKAEGSDNKVLLIILAILLPPLAVYLHQGEINSKFWISLLLTLLFFIPGVIYALLVVTGEV